MKKGFTLIEMLVVIGIIGILAGALMGNYSGIIERVRATKCQSNLRNLAQAVGTYAVCGQYPYAESAQYIKTVGGTDNGGVEVREFKGWISWLSQGTRFPIKGSAASSITHCSFANSDTKQLTYAITNGALWPAVGKNRECYLCPVHVECCRKKGVLNPGWSYQMNAYFGFERKKGQAEATEFDYIESGSLTRADRTLLFAEIQALESNSKQARKAHVSLPSVNLTGGNGEEAMGSCLKYKSLTGDSGNGSIGFNHLSSGKLIGHVAFADGHVESLQAPKDGNTRDLTDWLCQGMDVVFKQGKYDKINDSEVTQ